jgi:hypothetical protein
MALRRDAGALWVGKQTAKGVEAADMQKRLPLIEGGLSPMSESAARRYLDGKRFGKKVSFKKQTMVGGDVTILATPEALAYIESCIHTNDSVTGSSAPYTHAMSSDADDSNWLTFVQRIGTGSTVLRDKFVDCRVVGYEIEGSAGSDDPVTVTFSVIGLTVETAQAADPTPLDDPNDEGEAYVWTDITGSVQIDSQQFSNISQLNLSVSTGEELYFSDDITAYDIISGEPAIEMAGTFLVDDDGLDLWNLIQYGSATPSEGDGISSEEFQGSVEWSWSYGATAALRSATYTLNNVTLNSDSEITPSPEGGAAEISVAGVAEEASDGSPALEIEHKNTDSDDYDDAPTLGS